MTHHMREGVINNTEERENRRENKRGRNGAEKKGACESWGARHAMTVL